MNPNFNILNFKEIINIQQNQDFQFEVIVIVNT